MKSRKFFLDDYATTCVFTTWPTLGLESLITFRLFGFCYQANHEVPVLGLIVMQHSYTLSVTVYMYIRTLLRRAHNSIV